MKRFLDYNPLTGITEFHDYDHSSKETKIIYEYDQARLEGELDFIKEKRNDGSNGYISSEREMQLAAIIPSAVQLEWLTKYGIDVSNRNHWPAVRRLLNNGEWASLRVSKGKI